MKPKGSDLDREVSAFASNQHEPLPGQAELPMEPDEWVDCPECDGEGLIADREAKNYKNGIHVSTTHYYEECEFCGREGCVSPEYAAAWHAAQEKTR